MRPAVPILLCLALLSGALVGPSLFGAEAAPLDQTGFQTPTPGPDGRIIYIVKEGDSLWTIAALSGMSVEELRALNGIQPNDFISPGMELLLGLAGPAEPTLAPGVEASPTPVPATPTSQVGTGEVCIFLFQDENGNARWDEGEPALAEGRVSVADVNGGVAGEHTTDDNPEGYCFQDLLNGDYNVSAAVPSGYNPTTSMNVPMRVAPGDIKFVNFGAQQSAALLEAGDPGEGERSTLLGVVGVLLLVTAGALGLYATRYGRRTPKSLR